MFRWTNLHNIVQHRNEHVAKLEPGHRASFSINLSPMDITVTVIVIVFVITCLPPMPPEFVGKAAPSSVSIEENTVATRTNWALMTVVIFYISTDVAPKKLYPTMSELLGVQSYRGIHWRVEVIERSASP